MTPKLNLLEWQDIISPRVCRMLARRRVIGQRKPLSLAELSARAGLHPQTFARLSLLDSWETIPMGIACRFQEACGVTRQNRWKELAYFLRTVERSKRPLVHLQHPSACSRQFRAKLLGLPKSRQARTTAQPGRKTGR